MIGYEEYFFLLHSYVTQVTDLQTSSVRPPYPFCHVPPSFDRPLFCTINLFSPTPLETEGINFLKGKYGSQYDVEINDSTIIASVNTYGESSDRNIEIIVKNTDQLPEQGIGCMRCSEIRDFFREEDRRQVDLHLHIKAKYNKLCERLSVKEKKVRVNEFNDRIFNLVMGG